MGDQAFLSVSTEILGFLSIFKKSQASAPFEALKSVGLLTCQGVRLPVQMRLGPRAFSRDCREISDIPLSCDMKDEPAFMTLQGNPTLFLVRESRYPLKVRQQIQGSSHIQIAEGRLLLRCLWEGGLPLNRILGINSLLEMIWDAWSFLRVPVLKLVFL